MLRVCRHASHRERAVGGTDLAKRRSFDNPPPAAQSAPVCGVAHREQWHNVAGTQTLPDSFCVIPTVA